jgi:tetratricopeptide (TPR) repeat protein
MRLLEEAYLRHCEFYAGRLLRLADRQIQGEEVLAALDLEWEQILVARERALGFMPSDLRAAKVISDMASPGVLLPYRLTPAAWLEWLLAGRAAAETLGDPVATIQIVRALGLAYGQIGDIPRAFLFHSEALEVGRASGEPVLHGEEADHLARVHSRLGEHAQALELWEESLEVFRGAGNRDGEAVALLSRGQFWWTHDDLDRAVADFEPAVEILREVSPHKVPMALGHLAGVYAQLKRFDEAIALSVEALEDARLRSDRRGEQHLLLGLGGVQRLAGDLPAALESFTQSARLAAANGETGAEAAAVHWIGVVKSDLADESAKVGAAQQGLDLARASGNRRAEHAALLRLGDVHQSEARHDAAETAYLEAWKLADFRATNLLDDSLEFQAREHRHEAAEALKRLGELDLRLGRPERSAERLRAADALLVHDLDRQLRGQVLLKLGTALMHTRRHEDAVDVFTTQAGLARARRDRGDEGLALGMIASVRIEQERHADALRLFDEALAIHVATGNRELQMHVLGDRGMPMRALGDHRAAIVTHEQAIELAVSLGRREMEGIFNLELARDHAAAGDLDRAITLGRLAVATLEELDDPAAPFARRLLADLMERLPVIVARGQSL